MKCKPSLKHKYSAKPCTYDNRKFRSQLERNCYIILKELEKRGKILFFLREIGVDLPGGARHFIDYQVFTPDQVIFLECKGRDLPMGKLKRLQVMDLLNIDIHVAKSPPRS